MVAFRRIKTNSPSKIPPKWVSQERSYKQHDQAPAPTKIPLGQTAINLHDIPGMRKLFKRIEQLKLDADKMGMHNTASNLKSATFSALTEIKNEMHILEGETDG